MAFRFTTSRLTPRLATRAGLTTAVGLSVYRAPALRTMSTQTGAKKSGSNTALFLGLAALGGAAGYYYHNSTHSLAPQKTESKPVDYEQVYKDIADILEDNDYDDGSFGPVLVRLAWHASGTYDKDSKTGGSNAASMRFAPESEHGANAGLKVARDLLEPIKAKYPGISYGDLWTLAGVVAIQELGGPTIAWRPGRTDGVSAQSCTPDGRLPDAGKKEDHIRDIFYRMGFNDQEIVALTGAHALGRCHTDRSGFDGPWSEQPTIFSNEYFKVIAGRKWVKKDLPNGGWQWVDKNSDTTIMMLPAEISMYNDKAFRPYFDLYAKDNDRFFEDFSKAFGTLMELGVPFKGDEKVYRFKTTNA
ncbi:heme peroxidase [Hesseltinella vesiculosa]|uniref:Peroxidase n=1 Tax=Hesseltinella vesiculosa TaxID=101127 RepID=A0A1X2G804_9FUNG|nr:heme peroxidase [Hesseltinella vesiculosa]